MVKKYRYIAATSVPLECAFTIAGYIVNEKEIVYCQRMSTCWYFLVQSWKLTKTIIKKQTNTSAYEITMSLNTFTSSLTCILESIVPLWVIYVLIVITILSFIEINSFYRDK